jgi:hypothetical protein
LHKHIALWQPWRPKKGDFTSYQLTGTHFRLAATGT